MRVFTRDNGQTLQVVEGFRKQVLAAPHVSVQPKPEWTDRDYRSAAEKKVRHSAQFVEELSSLGDTLEDARVLEVGCGAGIDCLLFAMHPVSAVVGIDMGLPLFDPGEKGERTRRLAKEVLKALGTALDVEAVLRRRPVRFATMDATRMSFPDDHFDLLWSRAALEHIVPPGPALAEMARVVRPGGLIHHSIDPFYWLKGCHKSGVVDIPWAHARLTPQEYHAFLAQSESEHMAAKRSGHLQTLNRLTPRQWRSILEAGPFEILRWKEESWPLAEALLEEHPDVMDTLLDGVEPGDLTCGQVKVWMRNRKDPVETRRRSRRDGNGATETFTRDDGRVLRVLRGHRQRVLSERPTFSPRADWRDEQYATAAEKKLRRAQRFLAEFARWGGRIEGARVLDVGCGDGIACLLIALQPVRQVVGIDMELPLLEPVERHERTRRLTAEVFKKAGLKGDIDEILARLPVRFLKMDATAMDVSDQRFDLLVSRSAIEHIVPVEIALAEMARLVRPGGLIHLSTDPYFSPRGCHKSGVVDIPWAHARLSRDEFRRFVTETEGPERAAKRCRRLETLNRYTIRQWREKIGAGPFEILEWRQEPSALAETLLKENPDVTETVREGIERQDLIHDRLTMWLRKRGD